MQEFASALDIWDAAAEQEVQPIQPIHDKSVTPMQICLPTHSLHPKTLPDLGCKSVTLERLHWVRQ
jgi:hypothetical protein